MLDKINILLICNFIFSVGAIIGAALWAVYPSGMYIDYTFSSTYGFYWFISIFSFVFGVVGFVYHNKIVSTEKCPAAKVNTVCKITPMLMFKTFMTMCIVIFWLASSGSVASILRECIVAKEQIDFWGYGNIIDTNCHGPIVSTTFGFAEFITWSVIFYFVIKYVDGEYRASCEQCKTQETELENTTGTVTV